MTQTLAPFADGRYGETQLINPEALNGDNILRWFGEMRNLQQTFAAARAHHADFRIKFESKLAENVSGARDKGKTGLYAPAELMVLGGGVRYAKLGDAVHALQVAEENLKQRHAELEARKDEIQRGSISAQSIKPGSISRATWGDIDAGPPDYIGAAEGKVLGIDWQKGLLWLGGQAAGNNAEIKVFSWENHDVPAVRLVFSADASAMPGA